MSILSRTPLEGRSGLRIPSPGILLAAAGAILRTFANRRAARRVADLPDYLLTDIGLKRDDVHDALSAEWREDPTFKLAMQAARRRNAR